LHATQSAAGIYVCGAWPQENRASGPELKSEKAAIFVLSQPFCFWGTHFMKKLALAVPWIGPRLRSSLSAPTTAAAFVATTATFTTTAALTATTAGAASIAATAATFTSAAN
jgi:hypothetical protein